MEAEMTQQQWEAETNRLLRREALRRATAPTSDVGVETSLARVSAEVTAEAQDRIRRKTGQQ